VLVVAALTLAPAACSPKPPSDSEYIARVTADRAVKDTAFKNQSEPIPESLKDELLPLAYYSVDPAYNLAAALKPSDDMRALQMVYSDGAVRDVRRVGTLEFSLKGQPLQLSAYVEVEANDLNHLFVPFGDLTNGAETYPSGRLLDLLRTPTGLYELDFNLAYNPSCYFSPRYSCPVPPKENRLPVPIPAGEKIKPKDS
jgi:uncharacterized protein